jgi:uncharacterized membrane protein affecting hemolysin expression
MRKRLRYLLMGTLRRQLIVGMALVVALTMSVFVWDQTRREQYALFEQQSELAMVLANSVATSSAVSVVSKDYGGMQAIVAGLQHYPELKHAIVLDTSGRVLAHSETGRRGLYLSDLPAAPQVPSDAAQRQPGGRGESDLVFRTARWLGASWARQ